MKKIHINQKNVNKAILIIELYTIQANLFECLEGCLMYCGYTSARFVMVLFLQWNRRVAFYSLAGSVVDIKALLLFPFKIYPYNNHNWVQECIAK